MLASLETKRVNAREARAYLGLDIDVGAFLHEELDRSYRCWPLAQRRTVERNHSLRGKRVGGLALGAGWDFNS